MRILDLFSGIGGFALGMEMAGFPPPVAFCEIEPFCRQVLAKHWPEVPCFENARTLPAHIIGHLDFITAGFPCQPFSSAARGRNNATDLWPDAFRIIQAARPRWVVLENVTRAPIERAARDLFELGYRSVGLEIGAEHVGAPHKRTRRWLVGHADGDGESISAIHASLARVPAIPGTVSWPDPPRDLGVDDGLSRRMDRLAAIGNAVVPQVVAAIARVIKEIDEQFHS